jgi:hypothetical protein
MQEMNHIICPEQLPAARLSNSMRGECVYASLSNLSPSCTVIFFPGKGKRRRREKKRVSDNATANEVRDPLQARQTKQGKRAALSNAIGRQSTKNRAAQAGR